MFRNLEKVVVSSAVCKLKKLKKHKPKKLKRASSPSPCLSCPAEDEEKEGPSSWTCKCGLPLAVSTLLNMKSKCDLCRAKLKNDDELWMCAHRGSTCQWRNGCCFECHDVAQKSESTGSVISIPMAWSNVQVIPLAPTMRGVASSRQDDVHMYTHAEFACPVPDLN